MSKTRKPVYDPAPIRRAIAEKNITITEAAKKSGLSEVTFRKIRNGQCVNLGNLQKAAQNFGLKIQIVIERAA